MTLTAYTGPFNITVAGTVIDAKNITSCITVSAPNVVIKRSRVTCNGSSVIWSGSSNLLVEDVDVFCNGANGTTALTPGNYTARRVDALQLREHDVGPNNVLIEDTYIHDPIPCCIWPHPIPHTDSIQTAEQCGSNIRIDHNTVYGGYLNQLRLRQCGYHDVGESGNRSRTWS